jgi:hypothetical protein
MHSVHDNLGGKSQKSIIVRHGVPDLLADLLAIIVRHGVPDLLAASLTAIITCAIGLFVFPVT